MVRVHWIRRLRELRRDDDGADGCERAAVHAVVRVHRSGAERTHARAELLDREATGAATGVTAEAARAAAAVVTHTTAASSDAPLSAHLDAMMTCATGI